MEDIVAAVLKFFQNAQPTVHDQAQLEADAPGQAPGQCRTADQCGSGLAALFAHQGLPGGRQGSRQAAHTVVDIGFGDAVARQTVLRQVDAILGPVDGHVLTEIDPLQAGADRIRLGQAIRIGGLEQMQHETAHRIGRARAIVQQFGLVGVAGLVQVLGECRQKVQERLNRQGMLVQGLGQLPENVLITGREPDARITLGAQGLDGRAPGLEVADTLVDRGVSLVGQIIGTPCKCIDMTNRRAQVGGQQDRCNGEIFVVINSHGQAVY